MRKKRVVLGVGCRKGAESAELAALVGSVLQEAGLEPGHLAAIATIEGKQGEPAVLDLAEAFGLTLQAFAASRLEEETPRLANPSAIVFRETGCHGIAEAAALAVLGSEGHLIVPKRLLGGCTAALAGN